MANNVQFGNKEQFLEWLNPFIVANFTACQDYLDQVAEISDHAPSAGQVSISNQEKIVALENILKHLQNIHEKMKAKVSDFNG